MSNHTRDEQVILLAQAAGFSVEETGGGCTALQKSNADGSYILITNPTDPCMPTDPDQPVAVSWFEDEHGFDHHTVEYPNLATALHAARTI